MTLHDLQMKRWLFRDDCGRIAACELRESAGLYFIGVGKPERRRLVHRLISKSQLLDWIKTRIFW